MCVFFFFLLPFFVLFLTCTKDTHFFHTKLHIVFFFFFWEAIDRALTCIWVFLHYWLYITDKRKKVAPLTVSVIADAFFFFCSFFFFLAHTQPQSLQIDFITHTQARTYIDSTQIVSSKHTTAANQQCFFFFFWGVQPSLYRYHCTLLLFCASELSWPTHKPKKKRE